jgi:twinkle protein
MRHEPCELCGSSDAKAVYDDESTYCFSCERASGRSKGEQMVTEVAGLIPPGEYISLDKRKISAATCAHFGYSVGTYKGLPVHIALYRDKEGLPVAQHIRFPNKDFRFIGDGKAGHQLFGQHLWKPTKYLVVTEGELDTLSIAEMQQCKWPVVSLTSGAQGGVRDFKRNIEFLESFDKVMLCFDMDEPGQKAAQQCAQLLTPGKALIVQLPLKDASDMLQAGRVEELQRCLWNAKPFRPDGLLDAADMEDELLKPLPQGFDIPYECLNKKIQGVRKKELVLFTAGSGVGKSTVVHEIASHLMWTHGLRVGVMALEESVQRTLLRYVSIELNKPLHVSREGVSDTDIRESFRRVVTKGEDGLSNLHLYSHFGSTDIDTLLGKIRYMAKGLDIDFLVLDHISIVVSGSAEASDNERRVIDELMTKLRSLVEETGIGVLAVSHLKRPSDGSAYTEGKQVSLSALRGSASLEQLSDVVIALERNQQLEGSEGDISTFRVLKNRPIGLLGEAGTVIYQHDTGRLVETNAAVRKFSEPKKKKDKKVIDSELDF